MNNILTWLKNHLTIISAIVIATLSLLKTKGWIDDTVFDWAVTVAGAFGLGGLTTYVKNSKIASDVKKAEKGN